MLANTKKYLSLFNFRNLTNWSVRYLLDTPFSYSEKYPLVKIGSFLSRNKTPMNIEDGKDYKRVTIKINNGGVYLRDIERGENIGTKKQYLVKEGQFVFSRIDARNGAFGLIHPDLEGAVVTNDFPVFDVNNSLIRTEYLVLITTTKNFLRFAQSCSSGTTNRQRIDIDSFLNQEIPLPNLNEQDQIVYKFNKKKQLAELQEQKAKVIECQIEDYLISELGIEKQEKEARKKGLQFTKFRDIHIWSIRYNNKSSTVNTYPSVNLGDVLTLKSGQFLPNRKHIKGTYPIYGGNGITGWHDTYFLEGERLIIGRVGEYCGNIHLVDGKYWVTDNAFITNKKDDRFDNKYLLYTLTILNLNKFKVVSAQPSLSQKNITNVPIPLPPLSKQNEIVNHIDKLKVQIKDLRLQATQNREQAITDFEKEIFS